MKPICKSILLLFYLLFAFITVKSQNKKIDSLKIELHNHEKHDTTRVNLLNDLAFSYYRIDISKTFEYIEESEAIAEAIDFKKGTARGIYVRGVTEMTQSNFDKALESFSKALQLYEKINFKSGVANCYGGMGMVFKNKGDQRTSIAYYNKSIKIAKDRGDKDISANLINLGNAYAALGDYEEAILHLKNALIINENNKNNKRISACLNNIGIIYNHQGNHPLALEYYNKSINIREKQGDSLGIAQVLNNMGVIYKNQENYDKAIKCYEKALKISKRINSKKGISLLLNNIGDIFKGKEDYKSAIDYYNEALNISKEIGFKGIIPTCLKNIGEVYLQLNDNIKAHQYYEEAKKISIEIKDQRNLCISYLGIAKTYTNQKIYAKALINALKSKEISTELELIVIQRDVQQLLSEIYKHTGNFKKAFSSHRQFKILNDSLFNKKNIEKITQLEYEYKYKQALDSASIRELKLTKTVTAMNKDLEKSQRDYLLAIIAFLIISILLGSIIFFLKLRNIKSKAQSIVIEQKLLRSQMTPHFIFNSLSVLQGMILNKEKENSISYLSKFSKLLRTTLENSRYKTVSLSKELFAINNYMALQNLDISPPYNYHLSVDSVINKTKFKIPPMLIQPFIENAIEHAFAGKKENKEISVQLTFKDQVLVCTIADNGIGINTNHHKTNHHKNSLATTITSERLKMLSKDFKMKGSVSVENRKLFGEQGTLITLVIPYKIDLV